MKPAWRDGIALAWCVVALATINLSIADRERLLAEGQTVLLELAPVDPRSLMQGDYMALRFEVGNQIARSRPVGDGRAIVAIDDRGVATFRRFDEGQSLGANEVRLRYRIRNGEVRFATNAFFFEEGSGERYAAARYGEFRVDQNGDLLLTTLRGRALEALR